VRLKRVNQKLAIPYIFYWTTPENEMIGFPIFNLKHGPGRFDFTSDNWIFIDCRMLTSSQNLAFEADIAISGYFLYVCGKPR